MKQIPLNPTELNMALKALYVAEKTLLKLHNTCVQVQNNKLHLDRESAEITSIWYDDLRKLIKEIQLYS